MRYLAALLLLLLAPPASAQRVSLDDVEALLRQGEYAEARRVIAEWWDVVDRPTTDDVVRGHLLRGRLAVDPVDAEPDYLAVVLGHPTHQGAAEALLRLGQSLLLRDEVPRAQGYLQRLVADYPGSPHHGPGSLWLARAFNRAGHHQSACRVARRAVEVAADPDLAALLRLEEAASCRVTAGQPEAAQPDPDPGERPATPEPVELPTEPRDPEPERAAPETGNFAVQAGAFRQRDGAEQLASRLEQAGHDTRLVLVAGSSLLRVRLGRFPSAQAAGDLARQLKAAGFDVIVVADAHRERAP